VVEYPARHPAERDSRMNTYELCEELSLLLSVDDLLIVGSSCMAVRIFGKFYHGKARMIESNHAQGSMGAMIPTAIACALAGAKRVVCVDGEGSFCQNIQELEVVHRHNLNIEFIVIENGGYASIHNSENCWFGRISEGATFPDIEKVGNAFGVDIRVEHVPHNELPPPRENA
jgi:acetolactate synthase I/II/III large subunit